VSLKEHSTVIASEDISEVTRSAESSFRMSGSGGDTVVEIPCSVVKWRKRKKIFMDLSAPAFLKPFEYGWKRELVYCSTNESTPKKMPDIYYYTTQMRFHTLR
jgi:hypothetical protein